MQQQPMTDEPVVYDVDAMPKVANWRPLVQWFLAIPHWIIAGVLGYAGGAVVIVSFFAILFTGDIPQGLFNFQVMTLRYRARATAYTIFLHDKYPPFDFTASASDPGGDPVTLSIDHRPLNRWLPLVKWLLVIPHIVVIVVLAIGAFVMAVWAFFSVLFTGKYPPTAQSYTIRFNRYTTRVQAYIYLLTDQYPKFGLQ
jgi:roadblock/LC7 domain-containing protein